jgi:hypothetical protein
MSESDMHLAMPKNTSQGMMSQNPASRVAVSGGLALPLRYAQLDIER